MSASLRTLAVIAASSVVFAYGGVAVNAAPANEQKHDERTASVAFEDVKEAKDASGNVTGFVVSQDTRKELDRLAVEIKNEESVKIATSDLDHESKKALDVVKSDIKKADATVTPITDQNRKEVMEESKKPDSSKIKQENEEAKKKVEEQTKKVEEKKKEGKTEEQVVKEESTQDIPAETYAAKATTKGPRWWQVAKCAIGVVAFIAITVFLTAKAATLAFRIVQLVRKHGVRAVARIFTGKTVDGMNGDTVREIREIVAKEKTAYRTMRSCFANL